MNLECPVTIHDIHDRLKREEFDNYCKDAANTDYGELSCFR